MDVVTRGKFAMRRFWSKFREISSPSLVSDNKLPSGAVKDRVVLVRRNRRPRNTQAYGWIAQRSGLEKPASLR